MKLVLTHVEFKSDGDGHLLMRVPLPDEKHIEIAFTETEQRLVRAFVAEAAPK